MAQWLDLPDGTAGYFDDGVTPDQAAEMYYRRNPDKRPKPGFVSSLIGGAKQGLKQAVNRSAEAVGAEAPLDMGHEFDQYETPFKLSDGLSNIPKAAYKVAEGFGSMMPELAGSVAGGTLATAAVGGPEDPASLLAAPAGMIGGATITNAAMSVAPYYKEALAQTNDPDAAMDLAWKRAAASGATTGLTFAAFEALGGLPILKGLFKGETPEAAAIAAGAKKAPGENGAWTAAPVNAKAQLATQAIAQPAIGAAGQVAQNDLTDQPLATGVGDAAIDAGLMTVLPLAAHHGVQAILGHGAGAQAKLEAGQADAQAQWEQEQQAAQDKQNTLDAISSAFPGVDPSALTDAQVEWLARKMDAEANPVDPEDKRAQIAAIKDPKDRARMLKQWDTADTPTGPSVPDDTVLAAGDMSDTRPTQAGFEANAPGLPEDEPYRQQSDDQRAQQAQTVVDTFGPEQFGDVDAILSRPIDQQYTLYNKAAEELSNRQSGQAFATADGVGAPADGNEAQVSPASRPNANADRVTSPGVAEDLSKPASPLDSEIPQNASPADIASAKRAQAQSDAHGRTLEGVRAKLDAQTNDPMYQQLVRWNDMGQLNKARQDALAAREAKLDALRQQAFDLQGKIADLNAKANIGGRSASGASDRPFVADTTPGAEGWTAPPKPEYMSDKTYGMIADGMGVPRDATPGETQPQYLERKAREKSESDYAAAHDKLMDEWNLRQRIRDRQARAQAAREAAAEAKRQKQYEEAKRQQEEAARQQAGADREKARGPETDYEEGWSAYQKAKHFYRKFKGKLSGDAIPNADGTWPVDQFGFVMSSTSSPIHFSDHGAAAKWILKTANKTGSPQIFEMENHPSVKGVSVRQREAAAFRKPGDKEPITSEGKTRIGHGVYADMLGGLLRRGDTTSMNAMLKIARRIAPGADLRFVRALFGGDDSALFKADGVQLPGIRRAIVIAMNAEDPIRALRHESVHFLRKSGILAPEQWARLSKAAEAGDWIKKHDVNTLYADLPHEAQLEEAIAEEFAVSFSGGLKSIPGWMRPMAFRIRQWFRQMKDYFDSTLGKGATAAGDMARIEAGKLKGAETPGGGSATFKKGSGGENVRSQPPATAGQLSQAAGMQDPRGLRGEAGVLADASGKNSRADSAPLEGLPRSVMVDGRRVEFGPNGAARDVARQYMKEAGLPYDPPKTYAQIVPSRARRIAKAFAEMEHRPNDPDVRSAYAALIKETLAQWQAIKKTGLKVDFIRGDDPYGNPRNAILDVAHNNHLWVFPTDRGFGQPDGRPLEHHPLMHIAPGEKINGQEVAINDIFRIVHDYFGHIKEGTGFRGVGEENAWRAHASMYSPEARKALATETRGQNNWLNYGQHGEHNRTANTNDTIFAEQKVGLLPDWVINEGSGHGEQARRNQGAEDRPAASGAEGQQSGAAGSRRAGNALRRPIPDGEGNINVEHFSHTEGLTETDPERWGSNSDVLPRSERHRIGEAPGRTYFGIHTGENGGYNRENGVGPHAYSAKVKLSKYYDILHDPADINAAAERMIKTGDYDGDVAALREKLIKEAGYSGYWMKHPDLGLVGASFEPLKVTPKGEEPAFRKSTDTNSEGRPVAPTEDGVRNFHKWFEGSKVVDDKGRPLVVYHGTARAFEAFSPRHEGEVSDSGALGRGAYFTDEPWVADFYSKRGEGAPNIMPVYLNLKNPFIARDTGAKHGFHMGANKLKDMLDQFFEKHPEDTREGANLVDAEKNFSEGDDTGIASDVRYMLEGQGYDGVLFRFKDGHVEAVAFDPKQIKSATGNSGKFDPNSDNIAFAKTKDTAEPKEETIHDRNLAKDNPVGIRHLIELLKNPLSQENRDKLTSELVDSWDKLSRDEIRIHGKLRDATVSVYKRVMMALDDGARMENIVHDGVPVYNAKKGPGGEFSFDTSSGGLAKIFSPLNTLAKYRDYQVYAIARRAQRLMKEGRENLMSAGDIKEGLAMETPEFKKVFENYQKFNEGMMKFAVDTGVLTKEAADLMTKHGDYTPFYRHMEETGEVPGPRDVRRMLAAGVDAFHTLKGGTDKINDLAENAVRNAGAIVKAGYRNDALRRMYEMYKDVGELDTLEPGDATKGSFKFNLDGKEVRFRPHDMGVTAMLAGMDPVQRNSIYNFVAGFSGLLRKTVTLSTGFMLANPLRDTISSHILTGQTFDRKVATPLSGFMSALNEETVVREMREQAGLGAYYYAGSPKDVGSVLRREIGVDVAWKPIQIAKALLQKYEHVGESAEMANRVALYQNLVAKGVSKEEAAYQAKNLLNFSRRGLSPELRFMLPLIPFLNARIQGLYRLGETETTGAARQQVLKQVALRGAIYSGVALGIYAYSSQDDRFDKEPIDRRINYHIVYTGKDSKILIPKAFEFGAIFSTMPEFILDAIKKQDGTDLRDATVSTFLNTFAFNPMPQAIKPAIENMANYNFFRGTALENSSDQNVSPGERAHPNTSELSKVIGGATNVSPIKIDNAVAGYLGTLGMQFMAGMDSVLSMSGLAPEKPSGLLGSGPGALLLAASGADRFVKEGPDPGDRRVSQFYELKKLADQAQGDITAARMQGDLAALRELMQDKKGLLSVRGSLDSMGLQITAVNGQIKKLLASNLDGNAKQARLNALIQQRNAVADRVDVMLKRVKDMK